MNEAPASQMLFCQLASGFAVLLPCAIFFGQTHIGLTPSCSRPWASRPSSWRFASYLVWCQLLKQYLAARLGILVFMTPLFGVLFSVFILGDRIGLPFVAGSLLVLAGLFMVQSKNIGSCAAEGACPCRQTNSRGNPTENEKRRLCEKPPFLSWCALLDLNQRPSDYESPALTD